MENNPDYSASNCLVCGKTLTYSPYSSEQTCFYCGKKEKTGITCSSNTGSHYVCEDCHNAVPLGFIKDFVLTTPSKDPIGISLDILYCSPVAIPMLGCHHAYILTGAIMAALKNRGYAAISDEHFEEAFLRLSKQAIGGYCGLTGVCAIVPSGGIIYSILTGSVCGKDIEQRITMKITALLSAAIYGLTGPSCCKAYLFRSLEILVRSLYDDFGFTLTDNLAESEFKCNFADLHPHGCMREKCPYYAASGHNHFKLNNDKSENDSGLPGIRSVLSIKFPSGNKALLSRDLYPDTPLTATCDKDSASLGEPGTWEPPASPC